MEIRNLSPRLMQRVRLLVIVVVVILVFVFIQPFLWRMVRRASIGLRDKQAQVQQVNDLKRRIEVTQGHIEGQQSSLDQLTAVVPMSRDTIQALERLEGFGKQLGVAVDVTGIVEGESLKVARGGGDIPAFPLTVSVTVVGQPSQLLEYIEAVEHLQELSQIESFAIRSDEGGLFAVDIAVVFYLQYQDNGEE